MIGSSPSRVGIERQRVYASFWPRAKAFGLDYVIILIYLILITAIGFAVKLFFPALWPRLFSNPASAELTGFLLITLPVTLYFALTESSPRWRASWGKHRMGLIVSAATGTPISRWRGLARNLLKFVPWELAHFTIWQFTFTDDPSSPFLNGCLILVWVLVGANVVSIFTSSTHQAIYDRLARTWVMARGESAR